MGLSNKEGEKLAELSFQAKEKIVEIGALHGKSTSYLAQGGHDVYSIDLWDMVSADDIRKEDYKDPENYQNFLKKTNAFENVIPIKGSSKEIAKIWRMPIGLLFIDGDHTYEGAKSDYHNYSPFIIDGGILAMHDYHNPQVKEVIDKIVKPSGLWENYETVRYLFVARKK